MGLTTRELSKQTWPDYHRFFSQGNGWDHCACTAYQGVRKRGGSFAHERDVNLALKCDLVERGLAHGILVYAGSEPVGWCQFGPQGELPIRDQSTRKRNLLPADPRDSVWRITCFCTLKDYREQGVADAALSAALQTIGDSGGGIVQAYPVVTFPPDPQLDDLVRKHMTFPHQILSLEEASRLGGGAAEVLRYANTRYGATDVVAYDRRAFSVGGIFIHRHGPLWAAVQRVPAVLHPGTAAMFERQGFKATGVTQPTRRKLPMSRLVMERALRGGRADRRRGKSS